MVTDQIKSIKKNYFLLLVGVSVIGLSLTAMKSIEDSNTLNKVNEATTQLLVNYTDSLKDISIPDTVYEVFDGAKKELINADKTVLNGVSFVTTASVMGLESLIESAERITDPEELEERAKIGLKSILATSKKYLHQATNNIPHSFKEINTSKILSTVREKTISTVSMIKNEGNSLIDKINKRRNGETENTVENNFKYK